MFSNLKIISHFKDVLNELFNQLCCFSQLVAISECHVNQLQGKGSPIPDPQESVGALYQPRLDIMCEAYQKYCDRLQCALNLLQHLQEYPEFRHFLKVRRRPNERIDF